MTEMRFVGFTKPGTALSTNRPGVRQGMRRGLAGLKMASPVPKMGLSACFG
jgi:hypothetical protein